MKRAEKREQTRTELLEAATRVFAARGFGGGSIDLVAEEARYTSGAIYANFAGKEDLFLSAFEHQIARHVSEVTAAVAEAGSDAVARNRAGAKQWMDFLEASPEMFLLFVEYWAYAVRDPERRVAFAERFATFRETTARMLGRDVDDPLAIAVNALIYGVAFQRLAEPGAVPDDLLAQSLEALSRGRLMGVSRVRLSAGEILVRDVGSGRPVVFVHGFLTNGLLWRNVLPPLVAAGFRCIAPDWPLGSHTVAMNAEADLAPPALASLIEELLETLDLDDVVLVGNDTGGALAQMVAARRPARVGMLVLTPCDAFRNWPAWWSKPLRPIGYSQRLMLLAGQPLRLHAVQRLPFVWGWVVKRHPPEEVVRTWLEPGLRDAGIRRDFGKAFRATRPAQTLAAARELPRFGKPALVVWQTERTAIYPVRHGRRLAELLRAPLELVDDSYVYVPEDRPERLAELIASHAA